MKLLLNKEIVGIRDRGLPTESFHIYAYPKEKIKVLFDNTKENILGIRHGHYICDKEDLTFIVFPSQVEKILKDPDYGENDLVPNKILADDLLYSKYPDDTTFE